jgi:hypothetical protein
MRIGADFGVAALSFGDGWAVERRGRIRTPALLFIILYRLLKTDYHVKKNQ